MKKTDFIKGEYRKEDYHIHPRPDYRNVSLINCYINELNALGVEGIGFVEHGIRKSKKHKSILDSEIAINGFIESINNANINNNIDIKKGIEIDYFGCGNEYMEYIDMVSNSKLDYVIGAVHGYYEDYNEYLYDTLSMLENYKIEILGHFKTVSNLENYTDVDNVIKLLREKNIIYEINIAPRYKSIFITKYH